MRQLESEVAQLQLQHSQSEAARVKFSSQASELDQELAGLRVANSLLEQQVDSLQGEVGVAELVQQDLNHVLKVVADAIDSGELKVFSMCLCACVCVGMYVFTCVVLECLYCVKITLPEHLQCIISRVY